MLGSVNPFTVRVISTREVCSLRRGILVDKNAHGGSFGEVGQFTG